MIYSVMIFKDCTKAGKKNTFTSGCKNFQRSVLVRHESGGSQKFGKSVASAIKFFKGHQVVRAYA